MIRDALFWASCVTATTVTIMALGCATPSERVALTQLDDWLARKPVKQFTSVLPSDPELADLECLRFTCGQLADSV